MSLAFVLVEKALQLLYIIVVLSEIEHLTPDLKEIRSWS
jgi:hypothetical protein